VRPVTLSLALLLSGCATLDGAFVNRVVCTAGGDKAYVVSWWGAIGIASELDARDRKVICTRAQ
jgi:hypothetical protein